MRGSKAEQMTDMLKVESDRRKPIVKASGAKAQKVGRNGGLSGEDQSLHFSTRR